MGEAWEWVWTCWSMAPCQRPIRTRFTQDIPFHEPRMAGRPCHGTRLPHCRDPGAGSAEGNARGRHVLPGRRRGTRGRRRSFDDSRWRWPSGGLCQSPARWAAAVDVVVPGRAVPRAGGMGYTWHQPFFLCVAGDLRPVGEPSRRVDPRPRGPGRVVRFHT